MDNLFTLIIFINASTPLRGCHGLLVILVNTLEQVQRSAAMRIERKWLFLYTRISITHYQKKKKKTGELLVL